MAANPVATESSASASAPATKAPADVVAKEAPAPKPSTSAEVDSKVVDAATKMAADPEFKNLKAKVGSDKIVGKGSKPETTVTRRGKQIAKVTSGEVVSAWENLKAKYLDGTTKEPGKFDSADAQDTKKLRRQLGMKAKGEVDAELIARIEKVAESQTADAKISSPSAPSRSAPAKSALSADSEPTVTITRETLDRLVDPASTNSGTAAQVQVRSAVASNDAAVQEQTTGALTTLFGETPQFRSRIGYQNGRPTEIVTATAHTSGEAVEAQPRVVADFVEMFHNARRDGISLYVTDSFRTDADQRARKEKYGDQAAGVGHSMHQMGKSIDLRLTPGAEQWVYQHAADHNFRVLVHNNHIHLTWQGDGGGERGGATPAVYRTHEGPGESALPIGARFGNGSSRFRGGVYQSEPLVQDLDALSANRVGTALRQLVSSAGYEWQPLMQLTMADLCMLRGIDPNTLPRELHNMFVLIVDRGDGQYGVSIVDGGAEQRGARPQVETTQI